ncbi:PLD nuclease N-terminal domain-containing protein [Prescottella agglutinans]|uniref:PLD nuclease N-terminal domain-containing protein n=1 Tax=Prescottella agglutinans TaxID=1644129 RepID=UPI002476F8F8|nr:PLD nuclease N-terminal domain-containing protein [Prescottella agglutinans]
MDHNPTLPLSFDIRATLIMLTYVVLTVAALISIFRIRHDRAGSKFLWSALVIVLPLIGPAAWFLLGAPPLRRRAKLQWMPHSATGFAPTSLQAVSARIRAGG